jgi:type II secretory pathway component PulF
MLPTLVSVAPVSDWSASGQLLYSVSNAVADNVMFVFIFIGSFLTFVKISLDKLINDFRVDVLDNYQPYKIYRDIQASFFLLTMGSLLKSGIKTSDALKFLQKSSSPYSAYQIGIMIKRLSMGMQAGAVIATPFLGDAGDDIELYGQSSQFDEALTNTAESTKIKLTLKIEKVSQLFGTIMFVIVGASAVWGIQSFLSISGSIAKSMSE